METYNVLICYNCAELICNGDPIPENPSMGEIGFISITDFDPELRTADCGACGTHTTGNFYEAQERI